MSEVTPLWENLCPGLGKKILGVLRRGGSLYWLVDVVAPVQVRLTLIGAHPPGINAYPGRRPILYICPSLGEGVVCEGGKVQVGRIPAWRRPTIIIPIISWESILLRCPPPGVVAYGVWGPVLQAPAHCC